MNHVWTAVVLVVGVLSPLGQAATIYVNGQTGNEAWSGLCETWDGQLCGPKKTIAAGMAVANTGDTVLIASGVYKGDGNRDLDFAGKAITVRSVDPYEPATVAATVIDCEGSEWDRHRAFKFASGEGPDSVIAGLTVLNGCSPLDYPTPYFPIPHGGAVLCYPGSPTIDHCVFADNVALSGGAIYSETSSPRITRCTFLRNLGEGYGGFNPLGGALHCDRGKPVIADCRFLFNGVGACG